VTALIVTLVVLLVVGAGGSVIYLLTQNGDADATDSAAAASAEATPGGENEETEQNSNPSASPAETDYEVRDISEVQVGDCVEEIVDEYGETVDLIFADCSERGEYIFQVVERFDGTINYRRCDEISEYSFWLDDPYDDDADFVICVNQLR